MSYDLKIFTGNANRPLAEKIAEKLSMDVSPSMVTTFSDGELRVQIGENIRGADVYIIQPTPPPAENWMELFLLLDAAKRASAGRITAVIPYYGYARQDRKDRPRVPITSKLCADLLETSGANRVLTMDLHSAQIQAFFDVPVDHLYSSMVLVDHFINMKLTELVVVAPDIGSVRLARAYAKRLNCPIAILDKRRPEPNKSEVIHIIGEVKNKNIIILDDMVDTAGTLAAAAKSVMNAGAKSIVAGFTHGVLSGNAIERIDDSPIKKLVFTDTIEVPLSRLSKKFEVVSVSKIFSRAILNLHKEESISSLFPE